jgi:hypothetical protein
MHVLKIWPEYFEAVVSQVKTVELRREEDRHFTVGDEILLREWDPQQHQYTQRQCRVQVTHVLRDPDGHWLQPGVVALSIRRVSGPWTEPELDLEAFYGIGRTWFTEDEGERACDSVS